MRTLFYDMKRCAGMCSYLREGVLVAELHGWCTRSGFVSQVVAGKTTFEGEVKEVVSHLLACYAKSSCYHREPKEYLSGFTPFLPIEEVKAPPVKPGDFFLDQFLSMSLILGIFLAFICWIISPGFWHAVCFGFVLSVIISLILSIRHFLFYRSTYPVCLKLWRENLDKLVEDARFLDEMIRYAVNVEKVRKT